MKYWKMDVSYPFTDLQRKEEWEEVKQLQRAYKDAPTYNDYTKRTKLLDKS